MAAQRPKFLDLGHRTVGKRCSGVVRKPGGWRARGSVTSVPLTNPQRVGVCGLLRSEADYSRNSEPAALAVVIDCLCSQESSVLVLSSTTGETFSILGMPEKVRRARVDGEAKINLPQSKGHFFSRRRRKKKRENVLKVTIFLSKNRI